jgi:hypothetical protein
MSGSNTMCVARVLLETGILPMSGPTTELTLARRADQGDVRLQGQPRRTLPPGPASPRATTSPAADVTGH